MFRIAPRRFLVPISFLLIAGPPSIPLVGQTDDSALEQHFRAAQQDQQQGRLDAAVDEYKTLLHLRPNVPEVYMNLGLVYYAQARFADSAQALATAARLRPGMRGVSLWLGIDDVKLYRPAQGATLLRQAIHQDPNNKLAQIWLGTALWDAGQMDASLAQLQAAAARFPDDPDLLFALGEAYGKAVHQQTGQLLEDSKGTALSDRIYGDLYTEEKDWTKAEGHLRRAIQRDPQSVDALLELANVFVAQARFNDAKDQLDHALAIAPHSPSVLARSGELRLLIEQPDEGLQGIENALQLNRIEALDALGLPANDPISFAVGSASAAQLVGACRKAAETLTLHNTSSFAKNVALAALYARAGDSDSAQRAYRAAQSNLTTASSVHPTSLYMQAMAQIYQHRYVHAEPLLLRWLATHPADHNARYQLILVRRKLAMVQVSRLLAIAPDSYHVHQLLGQLYVNSDEDDKALAEYLAVATAQPNLPDVHFWLGHLYWKHGDADHALTELTRQLELDPNHAEANGELGAILVAEDRPQEAIPHLEAAIHSKPDLWPAYSQLGRAYASKKDYLHAEEVMKRGLAHDPDGLTHYQLGLVYRAEGKSAEAAQAFAQVRAIKTEKMAAPSGADVDAQGAQP